MGEYNIYFKSILSDSVLQYYFLPVIFRIKFDENEINIVETH